MSLQIPMPTAASPLVQAVRNDDLAALKTILAAGCDLEAKDSAGLTALAAVFDSTVYAPRHTNRYKIFEALIDAGANPNTTDKYGCTPLMFCLWRIYGESTTDPYMVVHDSRYTAKLLAAGADANAQLAGESVFYMALKHEKYEEAALILRAGADPLVGNGGVDAIGDGIYVRQNLVDMILANVSDEAIRIRYVEEGRKVLRGLLLILDGREYMSVYADNGWPRKGFITDIWAEQLHALYARFTGEVRLPLLKIWLSTPWNWRNFERDRAARAAGIMQVEEW
jgi:hypothetical protein